MAQQQESLAGGAARPPFAELIDLASARFNAEAVAASDDFFAERSNLLKPEPAVFIPGKFTERGKWMDGWESRRKREPGHDWCIIRLGLPGLIRGFDVDTSHFTGNYPESCSIDAAELGPHASPDAKTEWFPVRGETALGPSRSHLLAVESSATPKRATHVRLNIFPDGGVARLRVFGEVMPDWPALTRAAGSAPIDLAAAVHGGLVVAANDMHFGSRHNLIMPGRADNMGDGWETRRKRGLTWSASGTPNEFDWCIVRLGRRGAITKIEVDTNHFKGNFPESCEMECCDAGGAVVPDAGIAWRTLLPRTKLRASSQHLFEREVVTGPACTHARLKIYPDGGVSRLRLMGNPA